MSLGRRSAWDSAYTVVLDSLRKSSARTPHPYRHTYLTVRTDSRRCVCEEYISAVILGLMTSDLLVVETVS